MTRIAHKVPLQAFDHIRGLLENAAGDDGVISRADADKLVNDLQKAGKGTEAQAARNLFKMIDNFDQAKGARVTGYDLGQARNFVQEKMLENRDVNHNGYSKAEIVTMSKTGQALVELGRVLDMEGPQGRIGHDVPEKGMDHVAGLINDAMGPDGIASREDREALVSDLYKQGRGTEALATSYFFSFMDHRDYKPGARITSTDIDRAVEYAGESMLKNKDKNNNGYSKAEVDKFSTTAKSFLLIGRMIEAGIIDS
jgi:hypothetical protein